MFLCKKKYHFFSIFFFLFFSAAGMLLSGIANGASTGKPLAEAQIEASFGGLIPQKTAARIIRAAARLQVLGKMAQELDNDLAAQLGATDMAQKRTLASAVFPVSISINIPEKGSDKLVATARILDSPRNTDTEIRNALRQTDNLELRFFTLQSMEQLVKEGMDLLQRSEKNRLSGTPGSESPFVGRLNTLSEQLEARGVYLDELRQFDTTWRNAQEVALILEKAIPLDPTNSLLYLGLGEALLLLDRPYEALDALHTAANLPDTPARTFYMRGIAHLRLHLPTYAEDDFTRAIERRPDKAIWWRARGAARLVAGDHNNMCGDFYQACALGDCEGLAEVRKRDFCLEQSSPPASDKPLSEAP